MARWIAVLALAFLATGCRARVAGGLDEREAGRVVTALEKSGIPASADREARGQGEGWAVSVPSADASRARAIMDGLSMPRPAAGGFDALVAEKSLVPSASREKLAETVARGEEVEGAIEAVDGVVDASVIIARPDPPTPGAAREAVPAQVTASVLVKHTGGEPLADEDVRELVAAAVPGLDPGSVTVVMSKVKAPPQAGVSWAALGPFVVSSSSRRPLAAVLAVMALLNLLLGAWAVWSVFRSRARRKAPAREG